MAEQNEEEIDYSELGKNIFWFDGPIGRLRYLGVIMLTVLIILVCIFIRITIIPILPCPNAPLLFMILVIAMVYWITFVASSKRFYDITGSLKTGIICSVVWSVLNLFIGFIGTLVLLLLLIMPGKLTGNN